MASVDKLFTPFQRLHYAEEFEGAGVGLAVVQRATFRFTLPGWTKPGAAPNRP